MQDTTERRIASLYGALLGAAVGDALGIAYENLPPSRAMRLFPKTDAFHLLPGVGLISDDAEHVLMTARALARSGGDAPRFLRSLARELRIWIATLPAGTGLATARAGVKLWLGFSAERSGVRSAGNAPALRAALIGVACAENAALRGELTRLSTVLTHTDPKALLGSQIAAELGALATMHFGDALDLDTVAPVIGQVEGELRALLESVVESVAAGHTPEAFIRAQGWTRGVSGYIYHTISAALHAWLCYPDRFIEAVQSLIRCGGDTDSTAALLGVWMGAQRGTAAVPERWRMQLKDPIAHPALLHSVAQRVGDALSQQAPQPAPRSLFVLRLLRNLLFLMLVLAHVGRRALPPY